MQFPQHSISIQPLPARWTGIALQRPTSRFVNKVDRSPQRVEQPRHPYNLLFTDKWMALSNGDATRSGYSVNASVLCHLPSTERSDRTWLRANGPEALLNMWWQQIRDPLMH